MMKQILKISLISILGLICVDASAAPMVKKLGAGNSYKGTDSAVSAKTVDSVGTSGATVGRVGRSTGTIKPTSISKTVATPNTSRLSLGKYLHNSGVSTGAIKKVSEMSGSGTGTGSAGVSVDIDSINTSITSLNNRVGAVETGLETAVADVTESLVDAQEHMADSDIHVTAEDKATWNAKQDALTAGTGIIIDDGVISANIEVPDMQDVDTHLANTDVHVTAEDKVAWNAKQDALTAGTGISIENGVISADIPEQVDFEIELEDADVASGKMVSGIGVSDNTVTVTRSNVKIPVGGENANPTASIWIQ